MLRRLGSNPFGLAALVVLSALLLSSCFAIAGRAMLMVRVLEDEARLQQEVAELQARNEALRVQREVFASDLYLERIAREELGLVKPGDTAVLVVRRNEPAVRAAIAELSATGRATPVPSPAPERPSVQAPGALERLRGWLFGR